MFFGERDADETAPVCRHEVDRFGGDELGGHAEVAFVFTVFVVDENDHLARADVGDRVVDALGELGVERDRGHLGVFYTDSTSEARRT